jgi:ABC-type amino acid transport substrate-binding protein
VRAADIEYTAPYVAIEGAYLVRNTSALQRNEDVDRAGARVAVGGGSAYDLFLTRELKAATLVRVPTSLTAIKPADTTPAILQPWLHPTIGMRAPPRRCCRRWTAAPAG